MGSAEIQGELWSQKARDWAEFQESKHDPLYEAMLDAAGVGAGSRVCDVGCGSGGAARLAAERGAAVSGLDAAPALIEIARERLPGADLRVGDMEALPFQDDGFDAVLAVSSLQYSADRIRSLQELRRICAENGKVVVGLWGPPPRVGYRVVFEAVRDALPEPPPGKGPFELSHPGVLAGLIGEAGLSVVGDGEAECPFDYPDFATFWRANAAAGPLQGAMRQVGEEALVAALESALRSHLRPDGSLRFENTFQFVVAAP